MSTTINIDNIISDFGAYYQARGQNRAAITKKLFEKSEFEEIMTRRTTENTILEISSAEIGDIVQKYQIGWTPSGSVAFNPVQIPLQHFKVDLPLNPYVIADTWMDFMRENELDPTKFPLTKYILEELVIPKIQENIEMKEIFHGVEGTIVPGTALTAGNTMNGLKQQILDGIAAGTINRVLTTGDAITSANIYDRMEDFDDEIASVLSGTPMVYAMSKTNRKYFLRDKRAEGYYQLGGDKDVNEGVDFSTNSVRGFNALAGSGIIFITPKWNMISVRKAGKNEGKFDIQKDKREVNVLTDFYRGVGFIVPEYVYAYVPDAEMPAESGSGSASASASAS